MFYAFFIALGLMLGADSQGYGPEKLCHVMGGEYKGTVYSGGNGKEARNTGATVPFCTAGPSTLVEGLLRHKGVIE